MTTVCDKWGRPWNVVKTLRISKCSLSLTSVSKITGGEKKGVSCSKTREITPPTNCSVVRHNKSITEDAMQTDFLQEPHLSTYLMANTLHTKATGINREIYDISEPFLWGLFISFEFNAFIQRWATCCASPPHITSSVVLTMASNHRPGGHVALIYISTDIM